MHAQHKMFSYCDFFVSKVLSRQTDAMAQWKKHTEPALCQPTKANYMQSFPEGIKELLTLPNNNNNDRLTAFDPGQPG